jgi:hypothetical protein
VRNPIVSEQPRNVFWALWILPIAWLAAVVWMIWNSVHNHDDFGISYLTSFAFLAIPFLLLALVPTTMVIRRVTIESGGLVASYCSGITRKLPWSAISRVGVFDSWDTGAAKRIVLFVPQKGRRIVLTDKMSNFEEVAATVLQLPVNISTKPTLWETFWLGASYRRGA